MLERSNVSNALLAPFSARTLLNWQVALRREVTVLSESLDAAKKREAEAASRITVLERERNQTSEELSSLRVSHEQHTAELEKKIEELTSAVMLLRRKGENTPASA